MSGTQAAVDPAAAAPGGDGLDVEQRARLLGWRPKEQYKGPPDKWVDANEFVERGLASPATLAHNLEVLTSRAARLERANTDVTQRLDQAIETVNTMTTMLRTSEKRQYDRARQEIEAQRLAAVESGDMATFNKADTALQELDKTAPVVVQPAADGSRQGAEQPRRTATADDPAVQAFYKRNAWYTVDRVLTQEADIIHTGLLNARPDLTVEQNLAEVERRVKAAFPDRFTPPKPKPLENEGGEDVDENPRREEAGGVMPSAGGAGRTRRDRNARTFANIPEESKRAYTRYKGMLAGKGEPLTEAEWAESYWEQFEETA